jgi:hypothetical protein
MAQSLTAANLLNEITNLGTSREYTYISGNNVVKLARIIYPEGPVVFMRRNNQGQLVSERITPRMLTKMALVCSAKPNYPIHVDRLFSAGGNTRSALEALLAHTPHFFVCNPARVDVYTGEIKHDLKHIMWCPDDSHPLGEIAVKDYSGVITELEASLDFGEIRIPPSSLGDKFASIDAKRIHVQMQVALIEIGKALNLKTWIARNDHSVLVGNRRLIDLPGTVKSLDEIGLFFDPEIREAAALIDCIWFTQNGRDVPAIIEIEHSTGVTSGMTRMLKFREAFPAIHPIYTVVAPDELRAKVIGEISQDVFEPLHARYMPYTNVRELYGLLQRYALTGIVNHRFVEAFMERII